MLTNEKVLLQQQEEVALPLNLGDALDENGYESCIIKGRPCPGVLAVYPHNRRQQAALSCSECPGRTITSTESRMCISWIKLIHNT
jgi:hypothetical protein